jgi:hypothetical protein
MSIGAIYSWSSDPAGPSSIRQRSVSMIAGGPSRVSISSSLDQWVGSRFFISMAFQVPGRQHHLTNGAAESVNSPLTSYHILRRRLVQCARLKGRRYLRVHRVPLGGLGTVTWVSAVDRNDGNSTSSGKFRIDWTWKMKNWFLCHSDVLSSRLSPD